ncbi:hypothetical protein [Brevibacillus sp. SIMBA_040]|uniref:hypothetical protein n=2 Tax=Bacteria TaxID=2 RepID=UPI00397D2D03
MRNIHELHGLIGGKSESADDIIVRQKATGDIIKGDPVALHFWTAKTAIEKSYKPLTETYPSRTNTGSVKMISVLDSQQGRDVQILVWYDTATSLVAMMAIKYDMEGNKRESQKYTLSGWNSWNSINDIVYMQRSNEAIFVGAKGTNIAAVHITVNSVDMTLSFVETVSTISITGFSYGYLYNQSQTNNCYFLRNSSGYAVVYAITVTNKVFSFSTAPYTASTASTNFMYARIASGSGNLLFMLPTDTTTTVFGGLSISGTTSPTITFRGVKSVTMTSSLTCFGIVSIPRQTADNGIYRFLCFGKSAPNEYRLFEVDWDANANITVPAMADARILTNIMGEGDALFGELIPLEPGITSFSTHAVVVLYTATAWVYALYDTQNKNPAPISKHVVKSNATVNARGNPQVDNGKGYQNQYDFAKRIVDMVGYSPYTAFSFVQMGINNDRDFIDGTIINNDPKFMGIALENAGNNEYLRVQVRGIVKGLSNLVPGSKYYVDKNGKLTRKKTRKKVGVAISATELLMPRKYMDEGGIV